MPQNIIRFDVHPWGTPSSPISSWCEFPLVTMFAIDFFVFAIENGVVSQLIFASSTSCTFFVKFFPFTRDSLSTEHSTSTSWTISLRILGFDGWSVWNMNWIWWLYNLYKYWLEIMNNAYIIRYPSLICFTNSWLKIMNTAHKL